MVYPSLPVLAPRHHENLGRIFDAGATNIFNAMELPVTQVCACVCVRVCMRVIACVCVRSERRHVEAITMVVMGMLTGVRRCHWVSREVACRSVFKLLGRTGTILPRW